MAKHKLEPKTRKSAANHRRRDGKLCELRTLDHVIEFILKMQEHMMALDTRVTAALDAQDAKIADLSTKVDTFIATHQGNSEADTQAVVDRVTAQGAAVDAIAAKVTPVA